MKTLVLGDIRQNSKDITSFVKSNVFNYYNYVYQYMESILFEGVHNQLFQC